MTTSIKRERDKVLTVYSLELIGDECQIFCPRGGKHTPCMFVAHFSIAIPRRQAAEMIRYARTNARNHKNQCTA